MGPEPVTAPAYAPGDVWTYRVRDGFLHPVEWVETHQITEVGTKGIGLAVMQMSDLGEARRSEWWSAPGQVALGAIGHQEMRRFDPSLQRFNFPLTAGQTWNQWVDSIDEPNQTRGQVSRHVRVDGWTTIITPAGTFDAIRMRVITRYDDEEFWRYASVGNGVVWYSPKVRGVVREETDVQYLEKPSMQEGAAEVRTHHLVVELTAFTPGRD